ncbi:hypothetical protein AAG906_000933 [Vitis piasezkii]
MPTGINKLKDLRRLTTFVVGKHSGARITELQDLSHLRGALSILNLQNVVNAMDALKANLKKKEDLDDLVFAWDPNLLILATTWAVTVSQESVKMDEALQKVGAELYGNNGCSSSSIKPFGSLVVLRFEEMLEWEEWVCCGVEFPCLKKLYIKKCPKLKGDIPKHFSYLTKLEISECGQLVCCLPMAPSLCELKLDKCEDMVVRNAVHLTSLPWRTCHPLSTTSPLLNTWRSRNVKIFQLFEMGLPPMLETLEIQGCPILESLPEGMMQNNTTLQSLSIMHCNSLRRITHSQPQITSNQLVQEAQGLQYITSLETLYVLNREKLKSFPKHGLPSSLSRLNISKRPLLKKSIQALAFSAIIGSVVIRYRFLFMLCSFINVALQHLSEVNMKSARMEVGVGKADVEPPRQKTIWMVWALGGLLISSVSCMALKCAFLYRKNLDMVEDLLGA